MKTFIDLFSGIGGFRIPLEAHGFKCVGFSEIDKKAIKTYKDNFNTEDEIEYGNIIDIKELPQVDIITAGVPCQPWSAAGKGMGFKDTRGTLWFHVTRLINQSQPHCFILENVKGLVSKKNKHSLDVILRRIKGYDIHYKVLNARDFGLPQSRERLFIVGFKDKRKFKFPEPQGIETNLRDILEESVPDKYTISDKLWAGHKRRKENNKKRGSGFGYRLFDKNSKHTNTITARYYKDGSEALIAQENKNPRKLTPKECARLQGFETKKSEFFIFCDTRDGYNTIHSWDLIPTTTIEKEICMMILHNRRKKRYGDKDGSPLSMNTLINLMPLIKDEYLEGLVEKKILKRDCNHFEFVNSNSFVGINKIHRIYLMDSNSFPSVISGGSHDFIATVKFQGDKRDFLREVYYPKNFRELSNKEVSKLQGFPTNFKHNESDSVAFKQFGNAVPVNVVDALLDSIFSTSDTSA